MEREPIIERIRPDELGRVLDKRRIRRFYFLMLPVLIPVAFGVAGGLVLGFFDFEGVELTAGLLFGLAVLHFIAYCIYESFLIGYYPARCYLRWLRERIDRRTDAIVKSDHPDALFVQIIPRENWNISMGENAADVGLLVLDHKRQELRYEGDLERWAIPVEYVCSLKLRSFNPAGALPFLNEYTVVVLRVDSEDDEIWETPLACHPIHFEFWTPGKRRRRAEILADAIGHLVEPGRWPPVEQADLWPLKPPPSEPGVADYGEPPDRGSRW